MRSNTIFRMFYFCIIVTRWGTTISAQYTVANGVKQGGIIYPILFNMYMHDLSIALNNSGIGGYLRLKRCIFKSFMLC